MEQEYKYIVVTRCFTFNHALYIEDAMNGFVMQETSFPVVTLIVDDASTDGEPEVIRKYIADHFQSPYRTEETEYANIICAKHKTNANCDFVVFFLKYNHYSIKKTKMPYLSEWLDNAKYHALCEGDDYWIHPKKLQKQVSFLEENNDYGLVYSNKMNLTGNSIEKSFSSGKCDLDYLIIMSEIPTLTTCFRSSLYQSYISDINPHKHHWLMGDAPLWIYISSKSKVKYMDEWFGVYRVLRESASHSRDMQRTISFLNSRFEVRSFMANCLIKDEKEKCKILRRLRIDNFCNRVKLYLKRKKFSKCLAYIIENYRALL